MPQSPFVLFGMGHRRKLYYSAGVLRDACNAEVLRRWDVVSERIDPAEYRVELQTREGIVRLIEDEEGVFVEEHGDSQPLTRAPVRLPRFEPSPHAAILRALHQEILINIMPFGPVPNLWVYPRPWYRDAAMMLMCLARTGNLALVEPWVMGLTQVFDHNNAGHAEADNLGEALYMISLVSDRKHPLVDKVLKAIGQYRRGDHIVGLSDFAEHPVYQTKWLKYGLGALGMDDPHRVPHVYDSYGSLFWMDWREQHVDGPRFDAKTIDLYPYLGWAESHFHNAPPPATFDPTRYPLTWESKASQAQYWRLAQLRPGDAQRQIATPHTWHAAEAFLYLIQ